MLTSTDILFLVPFLCIENLCKCPAASRNTCELQKHGHCISLAKTGTSKSILNVHVSCVPDLLFKRSLVSISSACKNKKKLNCFSVPGMPSASKDNLDSNSHCSSTSSSSMACTPRLVPGHRMWADKNGRHVLGLIEDYNALRKQISEGQQVLAEMEISLREVTGTKLQEPGIKVNSESC